MSQRRESRRERRQRVQALLDRRDASALRALARQRPATVGSLVGLLNEREDRLRWRAIEALGQIARDLAAVDPETVRDLIRRQLWAMNDESGNVAWHAAEAVGEILCQVPVLAPEYLAILVSQREMPLFRAGVSWALSRLAGERPDLVQEHMAALRELLADAEAAVRGHAARALGMLHATDLADALGALVGDPADLVCYDFDSGEVVQTTVGELARQALERALG